MGIMNSTRRDDRSIEITADSVDAEALRLLETDPSEYFRQTHKRLPFGFSPKKHTKQSD